MEKEDRELRNKEEFGALQARSGGPVEFDGAQAAASWERCEIGLRKLPFFSVL